MDIDRYIKEAYLFLTLKILYPGVYGLFALLKPQKKNKIIFIEANLPNLSSNLKGLYELLKGCGEFEIHPHYLKEAHSPKLKYIIRCVKLLVDMADARYVFLCEASRVVSSIKPVKGCIIIQTWHGCGAFKRFGFSSGDGSFGGDAAEYKRYPYYKNYTYVTVSSSHVRWAYEEAMGLPPKSNVIQPVGLSRTDVFFDKSFIDRAKKHLLKLFPQSATKKIILYAPTFRGNVGGAKTPEKLDLHYLYQRISKDYIIIIKHHPMVKSIPEIPGELNNFALNAPGEMSVEELLCVSDICISDYSSLIFEYSLFERPIILFAHDLEEYVDERGFYYPYFELAPGPVVRTNEELCDCIENIDNTFDIDRLQRFREKFMSACDGHSTKRLLELVFGKEALAKIIGKACR